MVEEVWYLMQVSGELRRVEEYWRGRTDGHGVDGVSAPCRRTAGSGRCVRGRKKKERKGKWQGQRENSSDREETFESRRASCSGSVGVFFLGTAVQLVSVPFSSSITA